jgi:hypothetical protein
LKKARAGSFQDVSLAVLIATLLVLFYGIHQQFFRRMVRVEARTRPVLPLVPSSAELHQYLLAFLAPLITVAAEQF